MILVNIRLSALQLGSTCLSLFLGLAIVAHADESLLGGSSRQVPTTQEAKKALEAAAENAPNTIAPPLPLGSPKLDKLRARAFSKKTSTP